MKDLARIFVKAGDGGDGKVSFRHEKFAPKGGPDGGDGGRGGDVILMADENLESLIEFNYQKRFVAQDGGGGMGKKMHGADREELIIRLPVGTAVYEIDKKYAEASLRVRGTFESMIEERKPLVDLQADGQRLVAGYGGRGGKGNDHFKSPTNQTPQEWEPGQMGEEKWLLLELKVVADVGIIGLPNVGKSSLLKALTRANPRIAGYPFTTLEPNLGVATVGDKKLVLVDVPGVVEDAWEGKGIGPWFLRHLERCKILVHVLALDLTSEHLTRNTLGEQLVKNYGVVRKELEKYGRGLPDKKEKVVINKMELVDENDRKQIETKFREETGQIIVWVSAGMGEVEELAKLL